MKKFCQKNLLKYKIKLNRKNILLSFFKTIEDKNL